MSGIRITRARKAGNGLPCKRIALGTHGRPASDGSPCQMWAGTATRVEITRGASGLADLITEMDSSEALILGDHVAESATTRLVKDSEANPAQGLYGRTLSTFRFRPGEPAAVLLDFDRKGMPASVAELLDAIGGFEAAIAMLIEDEYGTLARVVRASTSAGLYNQETGERFPGGGGLHLYLLVMDGADIPRFLRDLQARAWLAGFGWTMVAGRGALLTRSIVDITVGSPERLVFEGPPLVVAPLAQDDAERRPNAHDGELIDTRIACPPLTEAERRQFEELIAAAKAAAKPSSTVRKTGGYSPPSASPGPAGPWAPLPPRRSIMDGRSRTPSSHSGTVTARAHRARPIHRSAKSPAQRRQRARQRRDHKRSSCPAKSARSAGRRIVSRRP